MPLPPRSARRITGWRIAEHARILGLDAAERGLGVGLAALRGNLHEIAAVAALGRSRGRRASARRRRAVPGGRQRGTAAPATAAHWRSQSARWRWTDRGWRRVPEGRRGAGLLRRRCGIWRRSSGALDGAPRRAGRPDRRRRRNRRDRARLIVRRIRTDRHGAHRLGSVSTLGGGRRCGWPRRLADSAAAPGTTRGAGRVASLTSTGFSSRGTTFSFCRDRRTGRS